MKENIELDQETKQAEKENNVRVSYKDKTGGHEERGRP